MRNITVLFLLFTIMNGTLFMILRSYISPALALLVSTASVIAITFAMYGLQEGAQFDQHFDNLQFNGTLFAGAIARPLDTTKFDFQNFNIKSGRTWGEYKQVY
jgi:hypothetical protein